MQPDAWLTSFACATPFVDHLRTPSPCPGRLLHARQDETCKIVSDFTPRAHLRLVSATFEPRRAGHSRRDVLSVDWEVPPTLSSPFGATKSRINCRFGNRMALRVVKR